MPTPIPHTAKSVFLSCIDDRLVQSNAEFIAAHGTAFHPSLAGGGAAILNETSQSVALAQIVAAYKIAGVTTVYLESHTDCGAYRLAGVTFDSDAAEIARLYRDLDQAGELAKTALASAGAKPAAIHINLLVVDPAGQLQARPAN